MLLTLQNASEMLSVCVELTNKLPGSLDDTRLDSAIQMLWAVNKFLKVLPGSLVERFEKVLPYLKRCISVCMHTEPTLLHCLMMMCGTCHCSTVRDCAKAPALPMAKLFTLSYLEGRIANASAVSPYAEVTKKQ